MVDQPPSHIELLVIDSHVEECCAVEGRAVKSKIAKEIFRLMLELFQVRPSRKVPSGHDEPPWESPGSAVSGDKEVRENREFFEERTRWTLSVPRTGGVLRANG